jgi:spore coat polysaccharide biosynthesis protein SpsF
MANEQPHVVAIVQARMRSTRLPGKVLKPIAGKPLLWHVLHRIGKCASIQGVIVATSTDPADDAIAEYCWQTGVPYIRGPQDNVLERFAMAAKVTRADVIVRVNADAPLIDPGFVDFLTRAMIAADADFVMLKDGAVAAHDGVDPMSRRALDKLAREAGDDPVAREHVSAYFKTHPGFVKIARIDPPAAYVFKGARLSVDTPADAEFIEAVYRRLDAQAGEANLTDLISLLRRDPNLLGVNAHIAQKPVTHSGGNIVFRCDGGGPLGLGHVKRSLALAKILRDAHGYGGVFAMSEHGQANALVETEGFAVERWREDEGETEWFAGVLARANPGAVIFDTRLPHGAAAVRMARQSGAFTAVIDDASERRLEADAAFYPPVPQANNLEWRGAKTQRFTGWEWVVLGDAPIARVARAADAPLNVLIAMGGSDPMHQTLPVARAVAAVLGTHRITVGIGPDVENAQELVRALRQLPGPMTIVEGARDLRPAMAEADLAVASFGVTAYELAAHGVPALYLALTPDHAVSAQACVDSGMGRLIGEAGCAPRMIEDAVAALIEDSGARQEMGRAGRHWVDGMGAARIASTIAARIGAQRERFRRAG